MDPLTRTMIGAGAAAIVAAIAWRRQWLSARGALSALVVGSSVVAGAGLTWGLLIVVFFVSSSLLSRARGTPGPAILPAKGSTRDAG